MARLKIVADTGPLVAAIDRADGAHALARRALEEQGAALLIPDSVVVETDYLLRQRATVAAARAFLDDVRSGAFQRVALDRGLFERAIEYDRSFVDLNLGIADGSVMALAEAERALILTFDFADFRATRPLRGGFWRLAIDEERFRKIIGH